VSGYVAFGAEISQDRKHAAIVAAGRGESGKVLVDLVWYELPQGAAVRLDELYVKHDPVAVVVDGRSQAGTLIKPLADAGIVVTQPATQDVAVAHGEFMDLISGGGLEHLDQKPLTDAVRAAQIRPLAGAQALQRGVDVDQAPLVAAELACWAFCRWEELASPGAWVI
jgi:hypothetical protein